MSNDKCQIDCNSTKRQWVAKLQQFVNATVISVNANALPMVAAAEGKIHTVALSIVMIYVM